MTMRYAHLAPERLRSAVTRLEGLTSSKPAAEQINASAVPVCDLVARLKDRAGLSARSRTEIGLVDGVAQRKSSQAIRPRVVRRSRLDSGQPRSGCADQQRAAPSDHAVPNYKGLHLHLRPRRATGRALNAHRFVDATPKCLTTKTCLRARCPAVAGAVASICGNLRSTALGTISA
jgi:hypothetical protein